MIVSFSKKYLILLNFLLVMHKVNGETATNLTKITWSHGTNCQESLYEVLASNINFIEADIVYGYLKDDKLRTERQPVMAHPPDEESDITLKEFLTQIWAFNEKNAKNKQKGVKLDFKSTAVFQSSLTILNEMWNSNYEIWLNADIFSGPLNNTSTLPVDPDIFLSESKKFPNVTLSTGWTTRWGPNFTQGVYDINQVMSMIEGLKRNEIKNAITFPVRAGIAAQSIESLSSLYQALNGTNLITFTIWSSDNDNVDVERLRQMIFHFGIDKIYVDVPDVLSKQLNLDVEPGNDGAKLRFNILVGLLGIIFSSILTYLFRFS